MLPQRFTKESRQIIEERDRKEKDTVRSNGEER